MGHTTLSEVENHVIISIDAERTVDKIQPFTVRTSAHWGGGNLTSPQQGAHVPGPGLTSHPTTEGGRLFPEGWEQDILPGVSTKKQVGMKKKERDSELERKKSNCVCLHVVRSPTQGVRKGPSHEIGKVETFRAGLYFSGQALVRRKPRRPHQKAARTGEHPAPVHCSQGTSSRP